MPTFLTTMSGHDSQGRVGKFKFFSDAANVGACTTSAAAVAAAVEAVSNLGGWKTIGPASNGYLGIAYGTAAAFYEATQKAVLTFRDQYGTFHRFQIPAPKSTIFEADDRTVNPAAAAMVTLIAAMTDGVTSSRNAIVLTAFVGGLRYDAKARTRANLVILSPLGGVSED